MLREFFLGLRPDAFEEGSEVPIHRALELVVEDGNCHAISGERFPVLRKDFSSAWIGEQGCRSWEHRLDAWQGALLALEHLDQLSF